MDLEGFLERQASGVWFSRDSSWAGDNDSQYNVCARLKISPQYFHGKEASAPLHMCACTSADAFFAESVVCISKGVVSTMHVQVCMLDGCYEHQRTHLLTRSTQHLFFILMYVQFAHLALRE